MKGVTKDMINEGSNCNEAVFRLRIIQSISILRSLRPSVTCSVSDAAYAYARTLAAYARTHAAYARTHGAPIHAY